MAGPQNVCKFPFIFSPSVTPFHSSSAHLSLLSIPLQPIFHFFLFLFSLSFTSFYSSSAYLSLFPFLFSPPFTPFHSSSTHLSLLSIPLQPTFHPFPFLFSPSFTPFHSSSTHLSPLSIPLQPIFHSFPFLFSPPFTPFHSSSALLSLLSIPLQPIFHSFPFLFSLSFTVSIPLQPTFHPFPFLFSPSFTPFHSSSAHLSLPHPRHAPASSWQGLNWSLLFYLPILRPGSPSGTSGIPKATGISSHPPLAFSMGGGRRKWRGGAGVLVQVPSTQPDWVQPSNLDSSKTTQEHSCAGNSPRHFSNLCCSP